MRFFITFLIFFVVIKETLSADCNAYKNENDCKTKPVGGGCFWMNGKCQCKTETKLDIIIVLDKSGSITSNGFKNAKLWLEDIAKSIFDYNSTRLGVIEFSTNVRTSKILAKTSETQFVQFIRNIGYDAKYTETGKALDLLINEYKLRKDPNRQSIALLITDGNPCSASMYQQTGGRTCFFDVCDRKPILQREGIRLILVGIGPGWDRDRLDCLVQDKKKDIVTASSYRRGDLNDIIPNLSQITCPVQLSLKLTEAKVMNDNLDPNNNRGRFIEFFNDGPEIILSNLKATGIINSVPDEFGDKNLKIPQQSYVVFYEKIQTNAHVTCQDCQCTKRSSPKNWCQPPPIANEPGAIYIQCCSNGCICKFNDRLNGQQISMTNWEQRFFENPTSLEIDAVVYNSNTWIKGLPGWSYELKDKNLPNDNPQNWIQSCNYHGTPGSHPVFNCPTDCKDRNCQTGGALNATCNIVTQKCICPPNFYSPTKTQCIRIPTSGKCNVTVKLYQNSTTPYTIFTWEGAGTDQDVLYVLTYKTKDGEIRTVSTRSRRIEIDNFNAGLQLQISSKTFGTVVTKIPPNGTTISKSTKCTLYTLPPTPRPTSSPSKSPTKNPTRNPTPAPTWRKPYIFFIHDSCKVDQCDCVGEDPTTCCIGKQWSKTTCIQADTPVELYQKETKWPLKLRKIPNEFPYLLNIDYIIEWVSDTIVNKQDPSQVQIITPKKSRRLAQSEQPAVALLPLTGKITVTDKDTGIGAINLKVTDRLNVLDEKTRKESNIYSKYRLNMSNCSIQGYKIQQECDIAYPNHLFLQLTFGKRSDTITVTTMPSWILPLVLGLIGFCILLAIILYICWMRAKKQRLNIDSKDKELNNMLDQNELGLENNLGVGNTYKNPMATGVPGLTAGTDAVGEALKQRQKLNNEFADNPAEKFVMREEVGQQKKQYKTQGSNDYREPLL